MNEEVLLEVKPKYLWWIRICSKLFMLLVSIFVLAPLIAGNLMIIAYNIFNIANSFLGKGDVEIEIGYIFGIASYILMVVGLLSKPLFFDKKNFEVTKYRIYSDRIEFEEGFINHKYTTIQLKDIKEIHLEQNFFQRKAELGSIRFVTPANNSTVNTGIYFTDIENSKYVYAKVKEIHEKSKIKGE